MPVDALAVHGRAGDVAGAVAHDPHVDAALAGGGLGEPDRRDLRIGEDHRGHGPVVGPRLDRRAVEDGIGGDARLVLAHVGEEDAAVDVADGVEPAAVDAGGAQLVVDVDRLSRLQPDRLEPEVVGVGPAADGHEELVADERPTITERELHRRVVGRASGPRRPRHRGAR